jgi:type II secretory pathway component PulJ
MGVAVDRLFGVHQALSQVRAQRGQVQQLNQALAVLRHRLRQADAPIRGQQGSQEGRHSAFVLLAGQRVAAHDGVEA